MKTQMILTQIRERAIVRDNSIANGRLEKIARIASMSERIKSEFGFLQEALTITRELISNKFLVCSQNDTTSFIYTDEWKRKAKKEGVIILSDGITHTFGMVVENKCIVGMGRQGGGCCGSTLYLSNNGEVLHGTKSVDEFIFNSKSYSDELFEREYNTLKYKMEYWLKDIVEFKDRFGNELKKVL